MDEQDALALSTVKKWHKHFREVRRDLFDDPRSGRPLTHDLGEIIHSVLEERPFTSCKVLCRYFRIGKATCFRILHNSLGLKKSILASPRVEREERRSVVFTTAKPKGFEHVVTGDESWFFLDYPRDSFWTESRDAIPDKKKI
jgi:hypothetical protein